MDNLYANVVTDMRKQIPNVKRGRYISFEKLGMNQYLTEDKINTLQQIVKTEQVQDKRNIQLMLIMVVVIKGG